MKKAFTLVELLVVIAIIGLLATVAVVSLSTVRGKARDSKRVADLRQIQQSLEQFFADQNQYPTAATAVVIGEGTNTALCSDAGTGFKTGPCTGTTYMGLIPKAPTPWDGASCDSGKNSYTYTQVGASGYKVTSCIGSAVGSIPAGVICATEKGLGNTGC